MAISRYYPKGVLVKNTIFNLITTYTHISTQSGNTVVFRLQPVYFCLFLHKGICCWYPFELHLLVDAIQMSSHNICFYKENQEKKKQTKKQQSHKHHKMNPLRIFLSVLLVGRYISYHKFSSNFEKPKRTVR